MTEARDVEWLVGAVEYALTLNDKGVAVEPAHMRALIADWRAKKAEIDRLHYDKPIPVTFHPITILGKEYSADEIQSIFDALNRVE